MSNYTTTYQQLRTQLMAYIKAACNNINSYSSNVSSLMKVGGSQTICSYPFDGGGKSQGTIHIIANTDASSVINVVSESTVQSQLDSFMNDNGIPTNSTLDASGIIVFWSVAAAFCTNKMVFVVSQLLSNERVFLFILPDYKALPFHHATHRALNPSTPIQLSF